ncbi:MAG: hypothetical protein HC818_06345 [Synechococcaceae cyanobacterium RM1_1_27]|nr:hypothetical protein [Synechococcaceae cyanobacterium RM1_1_27]
MPLLFFIQGETEAAEQLGSEAIRLDLSYTRLDVLRMNLWGPEIMRDVQILLRTSSVQDALRQATLEATQMDLPPEL